MKKLAVAIMMAFSMAVLAGAAYAECGHDHGKGCEKQGASCVKAGAATCQIAEGVCTVCGSKEGGCKCVGECKCGKAKALCGCGENCKCATDKSACKCLGKCACGKDAAANSTDPTAQDVVTDPVCGMDVKVEGSEQSYKYEGKTYHFCCENCKERFSKDPSKFLGE